jgi:hypothetical protein
MNYKKSNRREFLRRCARWSAFGALAGIGGVLIKRGSTAEPGSQDCVNNGICRTCNAYNDCGLPAALSARKAGMQPDTPGT